MRIQEEETHLKGGLPGCHPRFATSMIGLGDSSMCTEHLSSQSTCKIYLVVVSVFLCLIGCYTSRCVLFSPVKQEQPITMFNSYSLKIEGVITGVAILDITVSFFDKMTDTSNLAAIPVFTIDSICCHGSCLDSAFCERPNTWSEERAAGRFIPVEWGYVLLVDSGAGWAQDLWYGEGKIVPSGFFLLSATPFHLSCADSSVSVDIHARLLDRETGQERARETKSLRFLVKTKRQRITLSQSSIYNDRWVADFSKESVMKRGNWGSNMETEFVAELLPTKPIKL